MTRQATRQGPSNTQRAQWAKAALAVFTAETYSGDHPDTMHPEDLEDAVSDLICDLLHFARFHPRMDADGIYAHALKTFDWEVAEEENFGPRHDAQRPAGIEAEARKRLPPADLLEALDMLVWSLCPRKTIPVLKAAGYSADLWNAAHKNAVALLKRCKR